MIALEAQFAQYSFNRLSRDIEVHQGFQPHATRMLIRFDQTISSIPPHSPVFSLLTSPWGGDALTQAPFTHREPNGVNGVAQSSIAPTTPFYSVITPFYSVILEESSIEMGRLPKSHARQASL